MQLFTVCEKVSEPTPIIVSEFAPELVLSIVMAAEIVEASRKIKDMEMSCFLKFKVLPNIKSP